MKHIFTLVFTLIAFIAVGTADAKYKSSGFKSSSFKSSKKSTSGWGFSNKKSTSTPKKTFSGSSNKSATGFNVKKSTTSTTAKKSTAPKTKLDQKLAKKNALTSKNNAAAKKYGSKKNAESAYKKKMASSNKYTSPTPPAKRPEHVPQTVSVGGRNVNVTYNVLPGGGYGYGYMDPLTGTFMTLTAMHMISNAAMMERHGFGSYDQYGNPVYHQPVVYRQPTQHVVHHQSEPMSSGAKAAIIIVLILVVGGGAIIILKNA